MTKVKPTVESAPNSLAPNEQLKLWVMSGGRCAVCKEYLLVDKFTSYEYNFGEMAHNVGRKRTAESPRGLDPLPISERNKAENVLLLCHAHHKMIDNKILSKEFTVAGLQKLKKEHEDQIKYLTSLTKDQRTTVIRMVGDIRGATVELSPEHVRKAVLAGGKYPEYPLEINGQDFEIDLRGLLDEGSSAYWQTGQRLISEALQVRLAQGVQKGIVRHISLFAITRIPLLISLGFMLDDKIPVELYQKHRDGEEGWAWQNTGDPVQFEYVQLQAGADPAKVACLLNLSGTIQVAELPDHIGKDYSIYAIQPIDATPNRNLLSAKASLKNFTDKYHHFLSNLEQSHKGATELHVFPAIPVTAAVACGRGLMRNVQPALIIYDRNGEKGYEMALEVNR